MTTQQQQPIPAPPPGWDKKPVFVQVENDEKRLTIQFPNIDALADWLTKVSGQ